MLEKRFLVKNNSWKEFIQPGELTNEGVIASDINVFLAHEGAARILHINDTFTQLISEEEYEELYSAVSNHAKIRIKTVAMSGRMVKAELSIQKVDNSFVYLISMEDAESLLQKCSQPIQTYSLYQFGMRRSYWDTGDPQIWWVKEYTGPYAGIIVTGVFLKSPTETLTYPAWVGKEISNDSDNLDAELCSLKPTKIETILGQPLYVRS